MTAAHSRQGEPPLDEATEAALREAASTSFADTGIDGIDIVASEDHSGDSVILVQVKHHLVPSALNLKTIIAGDGAVRDAAWRNGERRFVYVKHSYADNQEVASRT